MIVTNRYNKKEYKVIEVKDKSVVLKRKDGTTFEIVKAEYNFYYSEKKA